MSDHAAPSDRTRVKRLAENAVYDPAVVEAIVDAAYVCHLGFSDDEGGVHVIPTAFWRIGRHVYIHGSNGSRLLKALLKRQACLSATLVDGLVLARSAFNHSMNYRSVVVYGQFELVPEAEKPAALDAFMAHLAKGRQHEARRGNSKELAATTVLRLCLDEAAAKVRTGPPQDDEADVALPVWAGVLPLVHGHGAPIAQPDNAAETPPYVKNWAT